jgi:hypothetical protein
MKKIFVRSPYFITIDEAGQTGSKIEVFIWNKGTTEPTTPTYTLTKNIPSVEQTETNYNIANYAKEYIKPIAPVNVSVPTEENVNTWCYCKVKRYKIVGATATLLDTETFVCLNGYTDYSGGYNNDDNSDYVLLSNNITHNVKDFSSNYINVFLEAGIYDADYDLGPALNFTLTERAMYKVPIKSKVFTINDSVVSQIFQIKSEQLCEPKYTPIICTFINRFGGWQYLTFFKANLQSIETTNKEFQLLPSNVNYNALQGQKRTFNQQGKRKVKCNTGWVNENYFDLIQDLLLSEVVLLDGKPAIVKSQSAEYKTHLKDKNINYEIDFEFNYGLINDVI